MNFIDAMLLKKDGKLGVEFGTEDTKTRRGVKYFIELPEIKNKDGKLDEYIDKEVIVGIRPEDIKDEEMFISAATTGVVDCKVDVTEMMGAETYLYLTCEEVPLTARVSPRSTARAGDEIKVAFDVNKIHVFDKETEKVLCN